MKKFISVLLAGCMVLTFASCDKEKSTKKDKEDRREDKKEIVEETASKEEVIKESVADSTVAPTGKEPTQLGAIDQSTFRSVMENHNCNVGSGDGTHGEKTVLLASTSSYTTMFEYHLFNSESDAAAFFDESKNIASASNAQITDSEIKWTTELNYIVIVYDGDVVIVANTMAGNSELASEMEGILSELGY